MKQTDKTTDEQRTRAAQWLMMLAQVGKHEPPAPVRNQQATARPHNHVFNQYRI